MSDHRSMSIEGAFRFVAWAQQLRRQPIIADICTRWGCSRATAYRYRNALADAMCQPIERGGATVPNDYRQPGSSRRLLTRAAEAA